MKQITLSGSIVTKLKRESRGSTDIYRTLCRESIAREWLRLSGIPSWRNPATPVINSQTASSDRAGYSILLADGSRFLVCPYYSTVLSLDGLASAKCFAALSIKLSRNHSYGSVEGCIFIRNLSPEKKQYCFAKGGLESSSTFLHYLGVQSNYWVRFICFTAKLILFGEPDAPGRGIEGVKTFSPSLKG